MSVGEPLLVRNDREMRRRQLPGVATDVSFVDETPPMEIPIRGALFHPEPFVMYYVGVTTRPRGTQRSSPIWRAP